MGPLYFSAVRDGDNERVAVGHHLGDRAHYIEKKRDKDGKFRSNHKFVNLEQGMYHSPLLFNCVRCLEEADRFNQEFKTRASRNISGLFNGGHQQPNQYAIEDATRNHRPTPNVRANEPRQSSSTAPIVTVPDDDDEEIEEIRPSRSK